MRRALLVMAAAGASSSACSFVGATAELGFAGVAIAGDVALASGTGGVPPSSQQDVGSVLGLGSDRGSPYLRGQLDLGATVITASASTIREEGSGTLTRTFGPLSAATPVRTELDLTQVKISLTHDFGLGPVKISPGIGLDLIDFGLRARDPTFGNTGAIEQLIPVPMLFVRAEGDVGLAAAVLELGWFDMPEVGATKATLFDLDAMLEYRLLPAVQLFVGYRLTDLDGHGQSSNDSFALDLTIDGWVIGGGVRF